MQSRPKFIRASKLGLFGISLSSSSIEDRPTCWFLTTTRKKAAIMINTDLRLNAVNLGLVRAAPCGGDFNDTRESNYRAACPFHFTMANTIPTSVSAAEICQCSPTTLPSDFLLISSVGFTNTLLNYSANACGVFWTATLIFDCLIHIKVFSVRMLTLTAILSVMAASSIRVHFWSWRLVYTDASFLLFTVELVAMNALDLVAKTLVACIFRLKSVAIFQPFRYINGISWTVFSVYFISIVIASSAYPFSAIISGTFASYTACNAGRPGITLVTNFESFLKGILILVIDVGLLIRLRSCISTDTLSITENIYKYTKLLSIITFMILLIVLCIISTNSSNLTPTWVFANNISTILPLVQIIDFYKYDIKMLDPKVKTQHTNTHQSSPVHTRLRRSSTHFDSPFLPLRKPSTASKTCPRTFWK
ncbi:hypothetical protein BC829DRAFT_179881 [Chytridium lagenaria]|nr:hypothetical protein BC829DRAFT_179881 [Chytridium lagenaria]